MGRLDRRDDVGLFHRGDDSAGGQPARLGLVVRGGGVGAPLHDEELFDSVPHAGYDQPVDGVVTPSGIIHLATRS